MSEKVNPETGEATDALAMRRDDSAGPLAQALQAQAIATVQARMLAAQKWPRNIDEVRVKLLAEAKRPRFADAAIFAKPMGRETIEGPSVRLAEAVLRLMGNMIVESQVVSEDEDNRIIRVMATDLESNATDSQDAVISKTVERKQPGDRVVLSSRRNSRGEPTFLCRATEDEMLTKTNAAVSKMRRNKILSLCPADIIEEVVDACNATCADRDAKDPSAARKQLVDAFVKQGVTPAELVDFLGHDLDRISPAEQKSLRAIFQGIKDGETTWRAAMEALAPKAPAKEAKKEKEAGSRTEKLEKELTGKAERQPGEEG